MDERHRARRIQPRKDPPWTPDLHADGHGRDDVELGAIISSKLYISIKEFCPAAGTSA